MFLKGFRTYLKEKPRKLFSKLKNAKNSLASKSASADLDTSFKQFFSSEARKSVHKFFLISSVGMSTYYGGSMTGMVLKKKLGPKKNATISATIRGVKGNLRQELLSVTSTNLFNAKLSTKTNSDGGKPKVSKQAPTINIAEIICNESNIKSKLPIKLTDTVVLQDRIKSIASVQVRNKKIPFNFREGQKIEEMASIERITRLSMILKNLKTGDCEYVANEKAKKVKKATYEIINPKKGKKLLEKQINGITNEGNKFKIKKSFRDKMLSNMGSILTQARAIRMDNSDGSMCFKMTEVVPDSIYTQLDIQNEDIICGINGKKIRSLNEMMSLFGKMNQIDQFQLSRKRNGDEKNIEYSFE